MRVVHDLYLEYSKYLNTSVPKPSNIIWMSETVRESLVMCMPQDRNIHNNIFGGHLMRLAFELAFSTGVLYSKSRIHFAALDDIIFKKPVPIGSLLNLRSEIVYAPGAPSRSFQIRVIADVLDPLQGTKDTTNIFHFTFVSQRTDLDRVMPQTYEDW